MWISLKTKYEQGVLENTEKAGLLNKLVAFLKENPDIDHYLDETQKERQRIGFIIGMMVGVFGMLIAGAIVIKVWQLLGYLNIPGFFA